MFFPVITKNSNCEMFQLRILGSLKNPIFRWGGGRGLQKTNIERRDYLKRGLGQFADLRQQCGRLGKKERVMFLRGRGDTQCTLCYNFLIIYT